MATRALLYEDILRGADDGDRPLEEVFLELFADIDARLSPLEEVSTSVGELQARLVTQGEEIIAGTIAPLITRIRAAADIGVIFSASSVSLVAVGLGTRVFVVNEEQRSSFAPAALLTISAADSPEVALFGRKIAYEAATGELEIEVLEADGSGSYSSWSITAGSRVAGANQMALAPVAGLDATTAQVAIAKLFAALGSNPNFAEGVASALAERYTVAEIDAFLAAKAGKTAALTALAALSPSADKLVGFSSEFGATLHPIGTLGRAIVAAADAAGLAAAGVAGLNSPTFTNSPKAPTAPVGTNTNQIASTNFVQTAIAQLVGTATPATLDTLKELAAALGNDPNFATTILNALAGKQPLDADLTAIAALTTQAFGRSVLEKANAADARTLLGVTSAATQAFETGFWTPLVSFGTANNAFVPSYTLQLGRYMKFGSWVIIGCRLQFSSNDYSASPPTGAFTITGLPFGLKTLYPTTFRVTKASPPAGHLGAYLLTSGDGTTLTIRSFLGASGEATWAAAQIPASTTDFSFIFTLVLDLA